MTAQRIVILTGAGISAESGLQTFRDNNGLWENHRFEEVATPEAFAKDPAMVQRFYNMRRAQLKEVEPNAAHLALAQFEKHYPGEFLLVTQNVDDLHDRAGSHNIIHMHGELTKSRCVETGRIYEQPGDITDASHCTCCGFATLRPHIVWFGEMPMQMGRIIHALETCDLFISIGTSGHVYPAAGFVEIANDAGARTVEINLEPSLTVSAFDESIQGKATEALPPFLAGI